MFASILRSFCAFIELQLLKKKPKLIYRSSCFQTDEYFETEQCVVLLAGVVKENILI